MGTEFTEAIFKEDARSAAGGSMEIPGRGLHELSFLSYTAVVSTSPTLE